MRKTLSETGKVALIGIVFFSCFAATMPFVALMANLFPAAHFAVHILPAVPLMGIANRFVLSPLEYHLNLKSFQYDPWFERKLTKRKAQQNSRTEPRVRGPVG